MKEGIMALSKVRMYTYLIFLFDLMLLVHSSIADIFNTSDRKILYACIMLIIFQIVVSILWIVKFATTLKGKRKQTGMMYASRVRLFLMLQFIPAVVLVVNDYVFHSYAADKIAILTNILFLIYVLKNLTILQRGQY